MTTIYMFILAITLAHTTPTYSISGRVVDDTTGEPLLFANVEIKNANWISGGETNLDGHFNISGIPSGTYSLRVSYVGYESYERKDVPLSTDITLSVIKMKQGVTACEIIITGYKVPLIELDNTTTGSACRSTVSATPGQMTAAEWNDLHNWEDWELLLLDDQYQSVATQWDIYPLDRYAVLVVNENNHALAHAQVRIYDHTDSLLWSARTDNAGKAELWPSAYGPHVASHIVAELDGETAEISNPIRIDEGTNEVVLNTACQPSEQVDIAFVVDATGSMADEISFLQTELLDVIKRVERDLDNMDLMVASVFYRDSSETYVTKTQAFTRHPAQVVDFIQAQSAIGGGDYPEAVDAGLQSATSLPWRPHAEKLLFLLLDAPPHNNKEDMNRVRQQISIAAEKGIKVIPVTASGIKRGSEFLMKYMALLTNGTYVFITDDSGIGNPHLAPVVEHYEVEYLNDLLVRLITQYATNSNCDDYIGRHSDHLLTLHPNPVVEQVTLKSDKRIGRLALLSNSGMLLETITPGHGPVVLDVESYVSGLYYLRVQYYDGSTETGRFIKI